MTESLAARFLRGLAVAPGRDAVRVGGEALTYAALHELALGWAGAVKAAANGPLTAVGVLAGKGVRTYAAILAGLYTGAPVVPLHPDFPAARTAAMLRAAGVSVLLADDRGLAVGSGLAAGADLPTLGIAGSGGNLPVRPADALTEPAPVGPDDPAYVLFTSGSTGRPKGVPISHASTRHYFGLLDRRYGFGPDEVFSQTFDLNFDCAMFDMFCAWGAGATLQAVPAPAYRNLPEFAANTGLSVWFATPSSIALVRRLGGLGGGALPTLRWSFFAGEALRTADAADWLAAAPRSVLENLYGPTELTVTVTGHRWDADTPTRSVNGMVPIGTVHEGHEHLLLDDSGGVAATEGELCIAGPQRTAGYLDPADDAGRFLHRDGRTYYRTGDRVRRLDRGELAYLGRLDSQVQIMGWRVELAEIDEALRGGPGVEDAVTLARPGPTGTELVAFYTGTPSPPAALAARLREVLPHAMVPKVYRHLPEFPLNANRKIDRIALTRQA